MSKILLAGETYKEIYDPFCREYGLRPLYIPENPDIDERLKGHADLNIFQTGSNTIIAAPYLENTPFVAELENLGCRVIIDKNKQSASYPNDCALNAVKTRNMIICSPGITSRLIFEECQTVNTTVNVKQGYIKCSVCCAGENAAITADKGIISALREHGIDVLDITPGYVSLPGFEYGFIGGASFMPDEETIVFTGTLDNHPDKDKIRAFIKRHGLRCIEMERSVLLDTGSAYVIKT